MNEIKTHCRYIKRTWGDRRIDDVRKNEIDSTLTKQKPHTGTRKKYLTHIKMFFKWVLGMDENHILTNPAEGLTYKSKGFSKDYFTPEQIKILLRLVQETQPRLLGYYSAMAFVGLRPSEAARVQWSDINFETHQLRVNDEGKTGERFCKLQPVALAWMKYHRDQTPKDVPFVPKENMANLEKKVRVAFRKLNDGRWIDDGLRHGFATFYNSLIEDDPAVAWYMGNSVATIKKHYAKRLPKSELDAFWGLTPDIAFAKENK